MDLRANIAAKDVLGDVATALRELGDESAGSASIAAREGSNSCGASDVGLWMWGSSKKFLLELIE